MPKTLNTKQVAIKTGLIGTLEQRISERENTILSLESKHKEQVSYEQAELDSLKLQRDALNNLA